MSATLPSFQRRSCASPALQWLILCSGPVVARVAQGGARAAIQEEISRRDIHWDDLIEAAAAHRIVPLAARGVETLSLCPPAGAARELQRRAAEVEGTNRALATELVRVLRQLDDRGVRAVAYKGPALALETYGELGLRTFYDLDLLVSTSDYPAAKRALEKTGYRHFQDAEHERRCGQAELWHADHGYNIDLHFTLTPPSFYAHLPMALLSGRLTTTNVLGQPVRTFDPEAAFLIVCLEGAKEHWGKVHRICDVAAMLDRHRELDWDWINAIATRIGANRAVRLAIRLAEEWFGSEPPSVLKGAIEGDGNVMRLSSMVDDGYCASAAAAVWTDPRHRFFFFLTERLSQKARFAGRMVRLAVRVAFTPTESDFDLIRLPSALRIGYYVVRPVRICLKAATGAFRRPRRPAS